MKKEITLEYNSDNWMQGLGIEEVHSDKYFEIYGGSNCYTKGIRVNNIQCAFKFENTYNWDECSIAELKQFLRLIEKLYVLNYLEILDEYGKYILNSVLKPEGTHMREFPQRSWRVVLDIYQRRLNHNLKLIKDTIKGEVFVKAEKIPGVVSEQITGFVSGWTPIFQSRLGWKITYGMLCNRCLHIGSPDSDSAGYVYGRFGFGFIPPELCLSRKAILFRKF